MEKYITIICTTDVQKTELQICNKLCICSGNCVTGNVERALRTVKSDVADIEKV